MKRALQHRKARQNKSAPAQPNSNKNGGTKTAQSNGGHVANTNLNDINSSSASTQPPTKKKKKKPDYIDFANTNTFPHINNPTPANGFASLADYIKNNQYKNKFDKTWESRQRDTPTHFDNQTHPTTHINYVSTDITFPKQLEYNMTTTLLKLTTNDLDVLQAAPMTEEIRRTRYAALSPSQKANTLMEHLIRLATQTPNSPTWASDNAKMVVEIRVWNQQYNPAHTEIDHNNKRHHINAAQIINNRISAMMEDLSTLWPHHIPKKKWTPQYTPCSPTTDNTTITTTTTATTTATRITY